MATGIFKLRDQLQGLIQKAWTTPQPTYYGSFNGSSQTIYASANSLNIRTNSFTMEGYFYANNLYQNGGLFGATTPSFYVQINTAGRIFVSDVTTDTINALYGSAFQSQTWTHIAISFDGTTYRLFFNGVLLASSTTLLASNTLTNLYIGLSPSNGLYFNGLISNFRFVKGTALYTANFAPPTGPLTNITNTSLLTLQNATIVDNSSNAFTITNTGSVATAQSNLVFPNAQKTPAVDYLVVAGGGGGASGGGGAGGLLAGIINCASGSALTVTIGGGGTAGTSNSSGTAATSGSNSVFSSITATGGGKAGIVAATSANGGSGGGGCASSSRSYGASGTVGQGNNGGDNNSFSTPYPSGGGGGAGTVGLNAASASVAGNGGAGIASAISGTVTTYSGGGGGGMFGGGTGGVGGVGGGGAGGSTYGVVGVDGTANTGGAGGGGGGNAANYSLGGAGGSGIVIISYPDTYNAPTTLTGTYTASTSGSGSIYMNGGSGSGGGPYLSYPNSSTMQFGSGSFTIEAWCYFTVAQESTIIARYPFDNTNNEWLLQTDGSLSPSFGYSAAGLNTAITPVSGSALSRNTWYHIAVVKNGTGVTLYINGTSVSTGTIAGSIYSGTTTSTVGCYAQSAYGNGYGVPNGYISNLRVVKGVAVYTSNFTPSTAPLTPISGTSLLLNTVSGSLFTDSSTNAFTPSTPSSFGKPSWNQLSPFATGLGYKNRVYTWTASGTVTF